MLENQQAIELEWLNRLIAIARQPELERPALVRAWQAEVDRVKRTWFSGTTTTLPLLFAASQSAFAQADFHYRCELGSMVILLAAERHRRKTGDWPGSIAAIDPGLLANPPLDPFTGQAFRMERRDGQLFIYSIGPNLEDEHGVTIPRGAFDPRQWTKGGPDDIGSPAWDVPLRRLPPAPEAESPLPSPDVP